MNDDNIFYLRIVNIDAVHKKKRRKRIGSLLRNHLPCQNLFVEIGKIFIDVPQPHLLQHEPLNCNTVARLQIGIFLPVFNNVSIQKRI